MFKGQYIDLDYLYQLGEGDNEFIRDMIDTFLKDAPGIIDRMETHVNEKQWKELGDLAHSYKTSLMFMGINELFATIREIEHSGRLSQNIHVMPELVVKVKTISQGAIAELLTFRSSI